MRVASSGSGAPSTGRPEGAVCVIRTVGQVSRVQAARGGAASASGRPSGVRSTTGRSRRGCSLSERLVMLVPMSSFAHQPEVRLGARDRECRPHGIGRRPGRSRPRRLAPGVPPTGRRARLRARRPARRLRVDEPARAGAEGCAGSASPPESSSSGRRSRACPPPGGPWRSRNPFRRALPEYCDQHEGKQARNSGQEACALMPHGARQPHESSERNCGEPASSSCRGPRRG